MSRIFKILIVLFILFNTSIALPENLWTVSQGRSSIKFNIDHLIMMKVSGRFSEYEGKIAIPEGDFNNAKVEARIKIDSIYTGNLDRDQHLKSSEFFNSSAFPFMEFKSTKIKPIGPNLYKMFGFLTIKNNTRRVVFDVEKIKQYSSNNKERLKFKATSKINRSDFGLTWNTLTETGKLVVGEKVEILMNIYLEK